MEIFFQLRNQLRKISNTRRQKKQISHKKNKDKNLRRCKKGVEAIKSKIKQNTNHVEKKTTKTQSRQNAKNSRCEPAWRTSELRQKNSWQTAR